VTVDVEDTTLVEDKTSTVVVTDVPTTTVVELTISVEVWPGIVEVTIAVEYINDVPLAVKVERETTTTVPLTVLVV
jgi:hypothetical protein